jgi:hypothetical protein
VNFADKLAAAWKTNNSLVCVGLDPEPKRFPDRFRDAFARVFGTAPSQARGVDCLYARWYETPLGPMLALAGDGGLHLLEFVDRRGLERELAALRARFAQRVVPGAHPHLHRIGEELAAYFAGRSLAALNGAVDRPNVTGAGRFTGKKQFVVERLGKHLLSLEAVHRNVAVRATAKPVIVPIMNMRSFELMPNFRR